MRLNLTIFFTFLLSFSFSLFSRRAALRFQRQSEPKKKPKKRREIRFMCVQRRRRQRIFSSQKSTNEHDTYVCVCVCVCSVLHRHTVNATVHRSHSFINFNLHCCVHSAHSICSSQLIFGQKVHDSVSLSSFFFAFPLCAAQQQ